MFVSIADADDRSLLLSLPHTRYIDGETKQVLAHQGIDFKKDWSKMTSAQGQTILQNLEGMHARTMRTLAAPAPDVSYVARKNVLRTLQRTL